METVKDLHYTLNADIYWIDYGDSVLLLSPVQADNLNEPYFDYELQGNGQVWVYMNESAYDYFN